MNNTYTKNFIEAYTFTMSAEGYFANHINDSGGMTWCGITRVYASKWKGWEIIDKYLLQYPDLKIPQKGFDKNRLREFNQLLNNDETLKDLKEDFYYNNYYKKVKADLLHLKVGVIIFDISVLQGTNRAVKTLQKLCNRYFGKNLLVDGIIGNITINTLSEIITTKGEEIVVSEFLHEYTDNLIEASKYRNNKVFLDGWMNRVNNLRNYIRLLK